MGSSIKPPAVGARIKEIRSSHSLTLDELSLKSGVSKSMLSQIESESVNPTIATVWKIANGLGIQFQALLEGKDEPQASIHVTRASEATVLDSDDRATHFQVLSPLKMADDLEFYILNLNPKGVLDSKAHYRGTEEYLTVLDGHIKVQTGDKQEELRTGDFIIYDVDQAHSIANIGDTPARVHLVVRFRKEEI